MNKQLNHFYTQLATDAKLLQRFNAGESETEIRINRLEILREFGLEQNEELLSANQMQLAKKLAREISSFDTQWQNYAKMVGNTNNTNNDIGRVGLS